MRNLVASLLLGGALLGCNRSGDNKPPGTNARSNQDKLLSTSAVPQPRVILDQAEPAPRPAVVAPSGIPVYDLKIDPADLARMEADPSSNERRPATFRAGNLVFDKVQVRFRGQWARTWPKKPIKIFFDHEKPFEGQYILNLNSGWRDPAFIRETLAYELYAACGVPCSRSRLVRLNVNGEFRGLYVEVEQVDKRLLERLKLKGATLYKTTSPNNWADERDLGSAQAYQSHYERETQKTNGFAELHSFCRDLALATNVLEFFERRVDFEKYISYLAANALMQNWDCFNKNHYLLQDPSSKKWFPIPWDLDRTFGDHWRGGFAFAELPLLLGTQAHPGPTGWNRMQERFFADPTLKKRFGIRLRELLADQFSPAKLFPVLDRLEAAITAEVALDRQRWLGAARDLHTGIEQVKTYIQQRTTFLKTQLAEFEVGLPR